MGPKILAKVQSELNLPSQSEIPLRGPEESSNKVVVEVRGFLAIEATG